MTHRFRDALSLKPGRHDLTNDVRFGRLLPAIGQKRTYEYGYKTVNTEPEQMNISGESMFI